MPVEARYFAPVQSGPGAPPASCTRGAGGFRGGKGRGGGGGGVGHPPPTSAEVKERVELYIYSSFGSSWPVLG